MFGAARATVAVRAGTNVPLSRPISSHFNNIYVTKARYSIIVNRDDEFNDLNKPCFVDGERVSPVGTCGGPPGDSNGS